ncbi:MAG: hypothetical protein ACP5P3_04435 [Ignavibacteria bacterium]
MSEWRIRNIEIDDLKSLHQLFENNVTQDDEKIDFENFCLQFNHLFKDNIPGSTFLLISLDENGKVIGSYGIVPYFFKLEQKNVVAGFPAWLMVDNKYRKKFLFFELSRQFLDSYKDYKIDFIFAYITRSHTVNAHLKLGYSYITDLKVMAKPTNINRLISTVVGNPLLRVFGMLFKPFIGLYFDFKSAGYSDYNVEVVNDILSIDSFLKEASSTYGCIAFRDARIYNWRFKNNSAKDYEIFMSKCNGKIMGVFVTRKMAIKGLKALVIVDLIVKFPDHKTLRMILDYCYNRGKNEGYDLVSLLYNPHLKNFKELKRSGYIDTREKVVLIYHSKNSCLINNDNLKEWYISWFEHDFV